MADFFETRNAIVSLASKKYKPGTEDYSKYSSIYLASTSNVKDTLALYDNYDRVLTVGATGAHAYEAILNGATKIDMFDINILQKYFYEYMQTAIMVLPYELFIKHFTLNKQTTLWTRNDLKNLLSRELFFILEPYLPNEVAEAFEPVFMFYEGPELIMSSLFRFEHPLSLSYLKKFISFYNEEEYYKLQRLLRSGQIDLNYICCSIDDIPLNYKGPYDLIILDNVLQYYKKIPCLNTPYAVNMFISKKLSPMLSQTGAIQVNYAYEVGTVALKKNLNIPYDIPVHLPAISYGIAKEQKEGLSYQLLKKWDTYSYDFITPVEEDYTTSQNTVLTYRPRKK